MGFCITLLFSASRRAGTAELRHRVGTTKNDVDEVDHIHDGCEAVGSHAHRCYGSPHG